MQNRTAIFCVQSRCNPVILYPRDGSYTPTSPLNSMLKGVWNVLLLSSQDFFVAIYNLEISVCIRLKKPRMQLGECLSLAMSYVSVVL